MSEPDAAFDYTTVTADAVRDGCDAAIRAADAVLDVLAGVPDGKRTFANTLQPVEEIGDSLSQAGGRYSFLSQVSDDTAIREAAYVGEERLDTYTTGLDFREEIARALRAYADTSEAQALEGESARLLEHSLRDFRRSGMELPVAERRSVQEMKERLVSLGIAFRRHIDDYEDGLLLTRDQLAGLPDSYIEGLQTQQDNGVTRHRVSLDYPEMYPFFDSAQDGTLREELFRKNYNKAADQNVAVLEEAIGLRDGIARALGYPSWAEYVLELRVARTPEAVLDFLRDLERRVAVKARADMDVLQASQQRTDGAGAPVAIWDWRYYTRQVLRREHDIDPFEVAEYFPLDATLDGMFDAYQALTGVRFLPHPQAQAWHPDVRFFDIVDAAEERLIGYFYMDLHPRPGKYGHAAAYTLQNGRILPDGSYQRPVSAIVANFIKPTASQPALLRHDEVITLFHEFGHILHQTLTRARYIRFSGTSVQRDFVEAPSQMLEHWCWESEVLRGFTRHHRSGDPLPEDLVGRMVAAKQVSSGIAALRQIYFARLDMACHGPGAQKDTDAIARELHPITGFPFPEETHFQAGFGHLFGYDAGYYGYLWSRVYGDDMFTRFEQAGLSDPGVGRDYRRLILEPGGGADGDALVKRFLGREPSPAAFLRDLGLDG